MLCQACAFVTDRLVVGEWRSMEADEWPEQDLVDLVAGVMTETVTRSLPEACRGPYTVERAAAWIAERQAEGRTLVVVERSTKQAVGLMILSESAAGDCTGGVDVRLGYLLAESAWGRGLASELVEGFVGWCRAEPAIRSLAGGVERDNVASMRVLEKNGFRPVEDQHSGSETDLLFELRLPR
jgi:RimJ/RimL family protein N-acetyltransferase